MTTYTVTSKFGPKSVVSNLTTEEAARLLQANSKSGFALDISRKFLNGERCSPVVIAWIHVMAAEVKQPERIDVVALVKNDEEAVNLLSMFKTAGGNMKYPKITLKIDGHEVVLALAGERARFPGTINVTIDDEWIGRIMEDGILNRPAARVNPADEPILAELATIAANPVEAIARMGKHSGACCYCRKELTDERSLAVGYGKICAKNWGLPWGK